jgi:hypothetical protein
VVTVRQSIDVSPDPVHFDVQPGCQFKRLAVVGSNDVIASMMHILDKQSLCYVVPVFVLKRVTAEVAPILASLFYRSLSTGVSDNQLTGLTSRPRSLSGVFCRTSFACVKYCRLMIWPTTKPVLAYSPANSISRKMKITAPGYDNMTWWVFKTCSYEVAGVSAFIIN